MMLIPLTVIMFVVVNINYYLLENYHHININIKTILDMFIIINNNNFIT